MLLFRQIMILKNAAKSSGEILVMPFLLKVNAYGSQYQYGSVEYALMKDLNLSATGQNINDVTRVCVQNLLRFLGSQDGYIWMRDHHMFEYYSQS